jgi:hypothetical protein
MEPNLNIIELFNNSPILNLASLVLAILGIFFTVYFYVQSKKNREPIYIIRTINLISDTLFKIVPVDILFSGNKINKLSISKIALWNDGKEVIKPENMAPNEPIKLFIDKNFDILAAEILFRKNNANNFNIDISEDKKSINITYDYFKHEEGVVLQVVHTANRSDDIYFEGDVITGKKICRKKLASYSFRDRSDLHNSLPESFLSSKITRTILKWIRPISRWIREVSGSMKTISGWGSLLIGFLFFFIPLGFHFFGYLMNQELYELYLSFDFWNNLLIFVGILLIFGGYRTIKGKILPRGYDIYHDDFVNFD